MKAFYITESLVSVPSLMRFSKMFSLLIIMGIAATLIYYMRVSEYLARFMTEVDTSTLPLSFEDIKSATQDDPRLISYLRDNLINEPSGKPYHLRNKKKADFAQHRQGAYFLEYYANKKNGTFIEAGAYDGETFSNTLNLELKYGWTGLLVEPNPISYQKLLFKNRKTHAVQCCLSDSRSPTEVSFKLTKNGSKVSNKNDNTTITARCFPLYALMLATNLTTVDLLSIDLEGYEIKALNTLPWEKIDAKAILVEFFNILNGKETVKNFIVQKNYTVIKEFKMDLFFVRNDAIV